MVMYYFLFTSLLIRKGEEQRSLPIYHGKAQNRVNKAMVMFTKGVAASNCFSAPH